MRPPTLILLALATPAAAQTGTLLIGNKGENSLSLVDLATGREVRRVKTGEAPHEIALSPKGDRAAVVAYGGRTIDIFELPSARRVHTIDLGANARPHGLLWLSDGRIVATAEGVDALMVVDPSAVSPRTVGAPARAEGSRMPGDDLVGTGVTAILTGAEGSHMVAVSPGRSRAYVANMGSGTVSVIDLAAARKVRDIPAGKQPEGIALTTDGQRLWVADRSGDMVRVFDTATFREIAAAPTGKTPIRVAITPDGRFAVVSNFGAGSLGVYDVTTARLVRTIQVGQPGFQQVTILFSPDGSRLYAAETGIDRVAEIDFATGRVLGRLPAGDQGDGLAISLIRVPPK